MKKKLCIVLTLCLTLCMAFYSPVQAGDGLFETHLENWITPPVNSNGYYIGIVEDANGYCYLVTCVTSIGGPTVVVSTSYYLMDYRFALQEEKDEYAAQIKEISAYVDVTTWDGDSDSFGTIDHVQGEYYVHTHTKVYSGNVLSASGRHGFGSENTPFTTYDTHAY